MSLPSDLNFGADTHQASGYVCEYFLSDLDFGLTTHLRSLLLDASSQINEGVPVMTAASRPPPPTAAAAPPSST